MSSSSNFSSSSSSSPSSSETSSSTSSGTDSSSSSSFSSVSSSSSVSSTGSASSGAFASSSSSSPLVEWLAWPGGQSDVSLNPVEVFNSGDFGFPGSVNWDVGNGGVPAIILETGSTTADGFTQISVRYDVQSPTIAEADAAVIEATDPFLGTSKKKKRTVFRVDWQTLNFSNKLDGKNTLKFPPETGTNRDQCEYNWKGENGATQTAGKMEATLKFSPPAGDWIATHGVDFVYSDDPNAPQKGWLRLHRKMIKTAMGQTTADANRGIVHNSADWEYDGDSDSGDAQYPDNNNPEFAFRIDWPGWLPADPATPITQISYRVDLHEIVEFHDGTSWRKISNDTNAFWYFSGEAVLPNGAKGNPSNHGAGAAGNVSNNKPVANAGNDQTVATSAMVQLNGSYTDADDDVGVFAWDQTAGTQVTLSDANIANPTFQAPGAATVIKFMLRVVEPSQTLHHHNPNTGISDPDEVIITVQ